MMKRKLSLALAVILTVSLFTLPAQAASQTFTDVPETHWAHDAIEYVVDEDLFAGTSATTFSPEGTMTPCYALGCTGPDGWRRYQQNQWRRMVSGRS